MKTCYKLEVDVFAHYGGSQLLFGLQSVSRKRRLHSLFGRVPFFEWHNCVTRVDYTSAGGGPTQAGLVGLVISPIRLPLGQPLREYMFLKVYDKFWGVKGILAVILFTMCFVNDFDTTTELVWRGCLDVSQTLRQA
ncbi:hypothetical protein J6590_019033 [Homalodisca vitripennis]|nr:hypothetical protein J6590_019033 [Homalodisca vitripennis]